MIIDNKNIVDVQNVVKSSIKAQEDERQELIKFSNNLCNPQGLQWLVARMIEANDKNNMMRNLYGR